MPGKGKFYAGVILMLIGGPGLALGSYLHNAPWESGTNHPPILGSWSGFGPLDQAVAIVGIIVMVIGIVLILLSGRGAPSEEEYEETEETEETEEETKEE